MNPTIDLFIGSPIELDSEKDFLGKLTADLTAQGESSLVFANFFPRKVPLQIDFLVVTAHCACHVELKKLTAPVIGGVNGRWSLRHPDGSLSPLEAKNPYRQALDGKLAISDEMHLFARASRSVPVPSAGGKFFKHFESVVCVYPELLPGSSVFSDHKVRVEGYEGLLRLLTTKESSPPGWTRDTWAAFAMHLDLMRVDEAEDRLPLEAKEARHAVEEYRTRFEAYYSQELPTLVPTDLCRGAELVGPDSVVDSLLRSEHVQLIGPSGCGKTLLARHAALDALRGGRVPIFAPAREYEGKLTSLLDRSIAHLHPDTASHFLQAAQRNGTPLALVLDGFNECPQRRRTGLLKDLQAFSLRWRVPILITSQEAVTLTGPLAGTTLRSAPLTDEQGMAILGSHASTAVGDEVYTLCTPFRSPYELSLAAECLAEIDGITTRPALFEAYIRRRCERTEDAEVVRSLLCGLAERMHRRVESSLTMSEAWRVARRVLAREGARSHLFTESLACGLLEVRQSRCAFRHELLERFLQAEALVRTHGSAGDLAHALARPRNRHLAEFVLGTEADTDVVRACLEALADEGLLADCLRGTMGEAARETAVAECSRLLRAAERALEEIDVELSGTPEWKRLTITGGPTWSPYDCAVLQALGEVLPEGRFLDDFLRLLRRTEQTCRRLLADEPGAEGRLRTTDSTWLFASLYVFIDQNGDRFFPASVIYHSARFHLAFGRCAEIQKRLVSLTEDLPERTHGELLLLCKLLHTPAPSLFNAIPALVRTCWETRVYHLRLEALQLAAACAGVLEGASRHEMIDLLRSLPGTNPWLHSAIVDAMIGFELVEPLASRDEASVVLTEILRAPEDALARQRAYGVVSCIFEDVYQGAYWEAIEPLPREDRVRLLTMAALGSPTYGFSVDWLLSELVKLGDRLALPAFERWCSPPDAEEFSPQDATSCFLLATIGRAQFAPEPRLPNGPGDDDRRAWSLYGSILHWMVRPGLSDAERAAACEPLWERLCVELPFEAVDPLFQFERSSDARLDPERPVLEGLRAAFPDQLRRILEFGVKHSDRLTSLFPRPHFQEGRAIFILRQLGQVGNRGSVEVLEPLLESPDLGPVVVEVVRTLKAQGKDEEVRASHR